jgi:hypothetical protein
MALTHSPKIVTNGLVFSYDMNNDKKSFKGAPTTNYAWLQNPRIDSSYAPYSATSSGTWNTKHPDAIRVYDNNGGEISALSNTGVTDWTNTYHAIWTYDSELAKPVVTMRDVDGNWKAKSFGLSSSTPASMGLALGSQYTISWLSWTDDITKSAQAGMYARRASDGTYNFYDGQSNSQSTSFNTLPRKWQRVYAVYTINSVVDVNASWSCYMYGMYGPRGTVKISDVQIESLGYPTGFNNSLSRSNTQAILDQVGGKTITATSLTYNANNTFSFNGSSNYFTAGAIPGNFSSFTMSLWFRSSAVANYRNPIDGNFNVYASSGNIGPRLEQNDSGNLVWTLSGNTTTNSSADSFNVISSGMLPNTWYNVAITRSGTNLVSTYLNGAVVINQASNPNGFVNAMGNLVVGRGFHLGGAERYFNGSVSNVNVYNRALSAGEIQQNFNALRGRYGI